MRRLLACFALCAVLLPAVTIAAYASAYDDQARAKSMLLRKSDFLPGFQHKRSSSDTDLGKLSCPGIESDQVRATGNARSGNFSRGPVFVNSAATVYGTAADAGAFWRDLQSKPGRECLAKIFGRAFDRTGSRLVSFRKTSFPRVAQRSIAFRAVAKVETVPVYIDIVMLKHSRATAMLGAGGALVPLRRDDLLQFARIVAGRMETAMRGA